MNKKIIFPAILLSMLVFGGCTQKPTVNPPKVEIGPVESPVEEKAPSSTPVLVGSDKDEHGCIGSAGYSWCEDKSKCIRIWEEDCGSQAAIKAAIIKKDKITSDFTLTISHENTKYASGGISFTDGGGMFLAAKINNEWQVVYSGNGSIDCKIIKKNYAFTAEMLEGFCD